MSDGETKPLGDGERLDWLRLIRSENVGPVVFRQLLERYGSPARALEALPELARRAGGRRRIRIRSEEHTSELQSLMRISYAVFCLKKKKKKEEKLIT